MYKYECECVDKSGCTVSCSDKCKCSHTCTASDSTRKNGNTRPKYGAASCVSSSITGVHFLWVKQIDFTTE